MSNRTTLARLVAAAALGLSVSATAAVDEIVLKNGSKVIGTITGARDGAISIDTDFAGTLSVSLDQVVSMSVQSPVNLQLADKSFLRDKNISVAEEQLVVASGTGTEQTMPLADLLVVNPEPWEMGDGYNWSGIVNFAFAMERGNSDTDELDYSLNTTWRSDDDRYTLKLTGEVDEANDQKNAENWQVIGKYDYFFSDVSYWGINAFAESDEFVDLDLRYFVGPYIGREFYTDPLFKLSAEVGISYVNEDFIVAEDQEYPASNWNIDISSNYLGGDSRLYFNQLGIWNLDETSDVVVNSTFGLAFPLLFNLSASAEILLEYDSGAVAGVDKLDETYKLNIGYTW